MTPAIPTGLTRRVGCQACVWACKDMHSDLTYEPIHAGDLCASCHDGEREFAVDEDCTYCHGGS